jgi:hypothetical protein
MNRLIVGGECRLAIAHYAAREPAGQPLGPDQRNAPQTNPREVCACLPRARASRRWQTALDFVDYFN